MNIEEVKEKLVGPVISIPTPLKQNFELDLEGLKSNVRFILENGFEGKGILMAVTAGGESQSMTIEERKVAMKAVAEVARGKVPIVTSAQHSSIDTIVDLANHAGELGYDCVQVSQPYYYAPSSFQIYRLFEYLSEKINVAAMIYNTPWLSGNFSIDVDLLGRLIKFPIVASVKWWDGVGVVTYMEALRRYADKVAFCDNTVNPIIGHMLGSKMWLDILGNFDPGYTVGIWDFLQAHRYSEALEELGRLEIPWYKWLLELHAEGIRGEGVPQKATLEMMGLAAGPSKPPYDQTLNEEQKKKLREVLVKANIRFPV